MKNIKLLLVIIATILLIPFGVLAEEDVTNTDVASEESNEVVDNKVNVYFFRGDGCSYCASAEEFFESIQDEYGQYFNLVDFETWNDAGNAILLENVAEYLGQEVEGVPYIVIGKQTWNGYASDYDESIKKAIKDEFEKDVTSRDNIIAEVKAKIKNDEENKNYTSDIIAVVLIVLVIGAGTVGIIYARKKA